MFEEYPYCRFNYFHEPDADFQKIYLEKGTTTHENRWRRLMKDKRTKKGKKKAEIFIQLRKMRESEERNKTLRRERKKKKKKEKEKKKDRERGKNTENYEDDSNVATSQQQRPITFLHVGKAGGSSLSCHIRSAFADMHVNCNLPPDQFPPDQPHSPPESQLSKLIDCYDHCSDHPHCLHVNDRYLINVRNPIERLRSWYAYEHVWNMPFIDGGRAQRGPRCGALMVNSCYSSLDRLAAVGLGNEDPRPSSNEEVLRVGSDLNEEECSQWAWAAVRGTIPSNYHNAFNYGWYADDILSRDDHPSTSSVELFVIRLEHLDQDWKTVDRMVGGNGDPLPDVGTPANSASHRKEALPVTDTYLSEQGIRNLCRALCEEIQSYKGLLASAVNLNEEDRQRSMEELRRACPEETSLDPRDCDEGRR
uniref:Sulfotransferase domain-containing protein n=1 Tax=Odontella aurita TaxID=265563 RepID=A0A7S4I2W5_9STRA|mmetsp:Transcript_18929/g.54856  ORF Transcript_18929/g.54856 Transcript_18929/m.54856 type:complete len:421 (+) Transcript_18929:190-1452(+)